MTNVKNITQQELLDYDRTTYDFRNTFVYKILDSSYKFKAKYASPLSVYIEPSTFIKLYVDFLKENISSTDSDFWNCIFGYEGSGKSSLSLMLFLELVNKNLNKLITNTIFLQNEYAKFCYFCSKNNIYKEPVLIDDAHYIFGKYNTLTKETLTILQLARFVRDQQIIHITNTQTPTQLYRDIWYERIPFYIYCFKIKKIFNEFNNVILYRLYACAYTDSADLKADMENIKNVSNWKAIISNYPPDLVTRFDLLFNKYSKEYTMYKNMKKFYKEFYSLFRAKGVIKGDDYEKIFKLLYSIAKNNTFIDKRLQKLNIIDKKGNVLDTEVENLANRFKKLILQRMCILER